MISRINSIHFNQECSCFSVAHSHGFNVYNSDPVDQWVSRDFGPDAGLAVASVLDRTNYMVLVGTGTRFPSKRMMLWNDQARDVSTVEYDEPILNALIGREVIVAVMESSVHIATLAPPHTELRCIETHHNPRGVAAMYKDTLVVPARNTGQIAIIDCTKPQVTAIVPCHRSAITAIAVNDQFIATASSTGTLIRIHDRKNESERWFRRGLDRAAIFSLAISPSSTRLAVLSDKQTLHIFDLTGGESNEKHTLAGLPFAPKHYFKDEWSTARVKTRSKEPGICGWVSEDTIIVLRPFQAQWEKYVVEGTDIITEGWKAIR